MRIRCPELVWKVLTGSVEQCVKPAGHRGAHIAYRTRTPVRSHS